MVEELIRSFTAQFPQSGEVIETMILGLFVLAIYFGLNWLLSRVGKRIKTKADYRFLPDLFRLMRLPLNFILTMLLIMILLPVMDLPADAIGIANHILLLVFIGTLAWIAIRALILFDQSLLSRYERKGAEKLTARKIHTQIQIIEKILISLIVIITVCSMLMTFDKVRELGMSILASAGLIGLVAGFAAQKSISTMFAGIQIAWTQPIRLDDVVVIEGEWGWVEEISLTYAVVKIWDERRLILPISYFLEKPFENWTRNNTELLGSVFFYLDYKIPLDPIREELSRILAKQPLWDKRVATVLMTDTKPTSVEVRILVSAKNSSDVYSLRCDVREKISAFLANHYPDSLPRFRVSEN